MQYYYGIISKVSSLIFSKQITWMEILNMGSIQNFS